MEDDVRKDETTDETEETTDRRSFLKKAGMVGGGALATIAGLASAADAQHDIRTRPQRRMGHLIGPNRLGIEDVASVEEFADAFRRIDEYTDTDSPKPTWAEAFANLSDSDAIAAATILEMRMRFYPRDEANRQASRDLGRNIVVLFSTLAAGMASMREQDITPDVGGGPRSLGNGCGNGCGNNCGNGCLSPVAAGFICGNGCGNNCAHPEAMGLACGGGCQGMGLEQLSIDREGVALEGRRFKGLNMNAFAAAMRNANEAFDTDLGGPFQREG